jgi:acyl carrier protein
MQQSAVVVQLKRYIVETILDGEDEGLTESTPLLEWGLINSLELIGLLSFIQQQFHVDIPSDKIVADNLANLAVLANLVIEQAIAVRK